MPPKSKQRPVSEVDVKEDSGLAYDPKLREVVVQWGGMVARTEYPGGLHGAIEELDRLGGLLVNDKYRHTYFVPRHSISFLSMEGVL